MTDDDNRARLARIFAAEEAKLVAELERSRASFDHRGTRGSAAEGALREFLGRHLPLNLRVGHGEVVDLTGRSRQTDVVITTEAQPFWPSPGEPGIFLAEAVYAAGEAKSLLTTGELDDVILKGRVLKELNRGHLAGSEVFARPADAERWVMGSLPFFALAFEMNVAAHTLIDRLAAAGDALDALFVLGRGRAVNLGTGDGSIGVVGPDGTRVQGWVWIKEAKPLLSALGWIQHLPMIRHRQSPLGQYLETGPVSYLLPAPDQGG